MSHLNGESLNIEDKNIEKLVELFPEVNTDGKIDFEKLKQILGEYVEDSEERYRFVWNGKGEALRLSQTPSMGTLRPVKEENESKNWNETENLYIEGDNLEVLKLLQKSYFNKVKMIYIDPPYNTGGDFVYKDNFKDNIQNYKKITGQVDSEGNATTTNREYSGRYHTDWLNMMYPRLRLARNLLTDDGVIFISIDDTEEDNLKKICDEIFGSENFVEKIVWKNKYGSGALTKGFANVHEYILCYTKSTILNIEAPLDEEAMREYERNKDSKYSTRGGYITQPLATNSKDDRPNLVYPLIHEGKEIWPEKQWIWSRERLQKAYENDEVIINYSNGKYSVRSKQYLKDENGNIRKGKPVSVMNGPFNQEGTKEISGLFSDRNIFGFPKPSSLIQYLFSFTINNMEDKDGIYLDFFSGSSTAAQSLMNLNAEDNGNRKFIMVQLPEATDKKSEAYRAGYENIAEIGKERIRRAGEMIKLELREKYNTASDDERKQMKHPDELDIGFKVFKLDSSNIKEWNPGKYENVQEAIEDALTPYVPGRTEEDVVYEMMLKMGLDLTYPVEEIDVNGKVIYSIGYGFLMICLADKVDTVIAEKMIEIKDENNQQEFRAIFRDEGFSSDTDKTNVKETLRSAGLAEESFITL